MVDINWASGFVDEVRADVDLPEDVVLHLRYPA
jgi:hypothetical protein